MCTKYVWALHDKRDRSHNRDNYIVMLQNLTIAHPYAPDMVKKVQNNFRASGRLFVNERTMGGRLKIHVVNNCNFTIGLDSCSV